VLRRLTLGYLYLPLFIFLWGWFRIAYALPLSAMALLALWQALRGGGPAGTVSTSGADDAAHASASRRRAVTMALLVALVWVALSGIGGFGHQRWDWIKHNAVLKALVEREWPVRFDGVPLTGGAATTLVYYLAYYLPSAAIGKALGWSVANVALIAWSWLGLTLALLWFGRLVGSPRIALLALFTVASGLDVVGMYALRGTFPDGADTLERWARYFQYSANVSLWAWVPQHALGGWLGTSLLLDDILASPSASKVGPIVAGTMVWTPFVSIGLVPFAVVSLVTNRLRGVLSPGNLAVLPLAGVVTLYYAARVYPEPLTVWTATDLLARWPTWLLFVALEAALYLSLCALTPGLLRGRVRPVFIAVAGTLTFLPLMRMGLYNDLVMRGSIPALFVMWVLVARALVTPDDAGHVWIKYGLAVALLVGCFTSVGVVARSLVRFHLAVPPRRVVEVPKLLPPEVARQYLGRPDAFFFTHLSRLR